MKQIEKLLDRLFPQSSVQTAETKADTNVSAPLRFDWLMTFGIIWLITGGYVDLWAHSTGRSTSVDVVFAIWHSGIYTGYLFMFVLMIREILRNFRHGKGWREFVPRGYEFAAAAIPLFAIAAPGDFIWHLIFGIERGAEGQFSPTHNLLIITSVLLTTGPLLAAWKRRGRIFYLRALLPALLSAAGIIAFISLQFHDIFPISFPRAVEKTQENSETLIGMMGIILFTILMMIVIMLLIHRWTLPFGSLTVFFTAGIIEVAFVKKEFLLILGVLLAGLLADGLYQVLKPSVHSPKALRLFAFTIPLIYYSLYFLMLALTATLVWRIHLWAGAIVIAGLIGLALSFVAVPPTYTPAEGE
jgi:hypothetical protein